MFSEFELDNETLEEAVGLIIRDKKPRQLVRSKFSLYDKIEGSLFIETGEEIQNLRKTPVFFIVSTTLRKQESYDKADVPIVTKSYNELNSICLENFYNRESGGPAIMRDKVKKDYPIVYKMVLEKHGNKNKNVTSNLTSFLKSLYDRNIIDRRESRFGPSEYFLSEAKRKEVLNKWEG